MPGYKELKDGFSKILTDYQTRFRLPFWSNKHANAVQLTLDSLNESEKLADYFKSEYRETFKTFALVQYHTALREHLSSPGYAKESTTLGPALDAFSKIHDNYSSSEEFKDILSFTKRFHDLCREKEKSETARTSIYYLALTLHNEYISRHPDHLLQEKKLTTNLFC